MSDVPGRPSTHKSVHFQILHVRVLYSRTVSYRNKRPTDECMNVSESFLSQICILFSCLHSSFCRRTPPHQRRKTAPLHAMSSRLAFPHNTSFPLCPPSSGRTNLTCCARAWQVEKKLYVLKKIRLARQSERQREASLREMRLLASLDHPNVLRYKEAWLEKGCVVCIVTSYCDGGDLMSLLQRSRGRYFREEILHEWFVQAALALTHIHKHRVLHRDVKSGNILLHNGMLQLADFGLAKQLTNGEKYSKTQVGTPNYMCPELLQEKPYNHKSDVWSLGCVMYELTALRPAFQAFNINGLINKIVKGSLAPMPSDYSPEWRTLVRAMLHKNPNERPELKELLKADFLKDTVRMVKERIKQELRDNPRDMEASQPPNITPQDLKKILQQRQEKDFARVDRDARDRGGSGARGQRGVSGRVGAGGGRFGANGVNNPLRQPSARVGGDGGGGAHRARAARGGA